MGTEEVVRYVMSILGGGLVVSILNWVKEVRSAARQRKVTYLQDQLRLLYGPLHCLTSQNTEIIKREEKFNDALHQKAKVRPHDDEMVPAILAQAGRMCALSNAFWAKLKKNNAGIRHILEENWTLIDVEDEKTFSAFLADCDRMEVEVDEKHAEGIDLQVNEILGPVYAERLEFVDRVRAQWNVKRGRLDQLLNPRWWHWSRRPGGKGA